MQLETHPALQLLAARPAIFRNGGHVAASWRQRDGRKFGPYYRLAFRDGDRQRSIYLGCAGPLVELVRQQLAEIQRPRTERRAVRQVEREIQNVPATRKAASFATAAPPRAASEGIRVARHPFFVVSSFHAAAPSSLAAIVHHRAPGAASQPRFPGAPHGKIPRHPRSAARTRRMIGYPRCRCGKRRSRRTHNQIEPAIADQ